jgi:hypothetical protein
MSTKFTQQMEFSTRLATAMTNAGIKHSATVLAQAFNYVSGEKPISVHAARKWLVGEAIPTQAKLLTLASMINVDAQWLRFGINAPDFKPHETTFEDRELIASITALQPRERGAVVALVRALGGAA